MNKNLTLKNLELKKYKIKKCYQKKKDFKTFYEFWVTFVQKGFQNFYPFINAHRYFFFLVCEKEKKIDR